MFDSSSRYDRVEDDTLLDGQGREVSYKRIRTLPHGEEETTAIVRTGERIDQLAYRVLGDPRRFWQICDANRAMWPGDLAKELGRRFIVPTGVERQL